MNSRSRVGAFARSFCCQSFDRAMMHDTAFRGRLFPVPLPYPEALCIEEPEMTRRGCVRRGQCVQ